ncbi:MAG: glycosyltransferase family 4 protein [Gemmatimonadota bacterium]
MSAPERVDSHVAADSAVARPRLLFLCQTLPYPPDGGVQIRTYNVLRLLARDFDVTALCFYRTGLLPTAERVAKSVRELGRLGDIQEFPIPQEHSKRRLLMDHLRSVLSGRAYTVTAYDSAPFRSRLVQLLAEKRFDLVHMDSLDLAGYVPLLRDLPVVCVHHNVESALLRSRAQTFRAPARAYLTYQAHLTENEEKRFIPSIDLNIAVSRDDAEAIRRLAPSSRVVVIPNGVDTQAFTPGSDAGESGGLVFVGGHSWQPNRDAMAYFCEEILPIIRQRGVNPPVTWVGSASEEAKREYLERYSVRLTGYVDDIRPFVHQAACYIAPLRAGGGTRLKILDAWAMGKALVSTTVGCEGLDARDGDNIVIRDTPADFAQAVIELLAGAELRQRIGRSARRTAERVYDWEVIGVDMLAHYRTLLTSGARSA